MTTGLARIVAFPVRAISRSPVEIFPVLAITLLLARSARGQCPEGARAAGVARVHIEILQLGNLCGTQSGGHSHDKKRYHNACDHHIFHGLAFLASAFPRERLRDAGADRPNASTKQLGNEEQLKHLPPCRPTEDAMPLATRGQSLPLGTCSFAATNRPARAGTFIFSPLSGESPP